MNRRAIAGGAVAAGLGLVAGGYVLVQRAQAGGPEKPPGGARAVELTVYNQDFALVRETRPVELKSGANRLAFADVSRELDPHSVLLRWQGQEKDGLPQIIGHSYDLGVASSQALLKHEIGQAVELVRYGDNGREAGRDRGRLLVAENGNPAVVEIDGKLHVNPPATVVVPADDSVSMIPQLTLEAQSAAARSAVLDLAYLTRGLSWSADYVATLPGDTEDRMDLECYATVTNRTGVRYPGAAVSLVAGSPNRAARKARQRAEPEGPGGAPASRPNAFDLNTELRAVQAPEAVGDLYTYPLKNPATIHDEQLNRLLMMERGGLRVKKDYSYRAPFLDCYSSSQDPRGRVTVALSFLNDARQGMGVPLPQGAIRVYDSNKAGRLRYAGAADIPPTPKNRKVSLTLANAFDVWAEYRTVSSKALGRRKVRKQVEVLLRNERARPVPVRVVQGFYSGWSVAHSSHPQVRLDSGTAQWSIPVPAGGSTRLTYAVDLSW